MTLIYIIIIVLLMAIVLLINGRIFIKAQNSGWYPYFLKPVIDVILNENNRKVLDIGTGPGILPELLSKKDPSLLVTGIDINKAYIDRAKTRESNQNISFQYQKANERLAFSNKEFDVVTLCSVLFLVDDTAKTFLVKEALRVLKPKGRIVVLHPSGLKSLPGAFSEIWRFPISRFNWTYFIWKAVTKSGGQNWRQREWLKQLSDDAGLKYSRALTFSNNAIIEIISK